jgi:hypothetical protein
MSDGVNVSHNLIETSQIFSVVFFYHHNERILKNHQKNGGIPQKTNSDKSCNFPTPPHILLSYLVVVVVLVLDHCWWW